MRNFTKEGQCSLDDLIDLLSSLLDCAILAKQVESTEELQNTINISMLNVNYLNGHVNAGIEYSIGLKENNNDDEERTFREST